MTNVQSKFSEAVFCTCKDFQHPWTDKCINASAGLLLAASPYCLRVYTVVYALSLIMRNRIPTRQDIKNTLKGILQSSAFLTTNAYTFIMYNCLIRNFIGRYYWFTVAFVPCFLSALTGIIVERPARRPLLALYVANVATETIWNMCERRGLVRSIPHGQTMIFGVSISILLYLYRLGLHKSSCKDSIFNTFKLFVGNSEQGPLKKPATETNPRRSSRPAPSFTSISSLVQIYDHYIKAKHESCQHREPCVQYAVIGGLKPFVGGVGLQVALKLLMNMKKIAQMKMDWRKTIFNRSTLSLGVFLGSFSFLYKAVSCTLRHTLGRDDASYAIPAGLIGSLAFTQYPDVTVALYVMWKTLQLVYNLGIEKGIVPQVPGFIIMLYSFCTALLFHAGILEPKTLRPSYYKFLQAISGERLSKFQTTHFDVYGLNTGQSTKEVLKSLNIVDKSPFPKNAFAF